MIHSIVHHFHEHEEEKHCEANDGEQHFHGEEYAFNHCDLCDFNFSEEQFIDHHRFSNCSTLIENKLTAYFLLPYFSNDQYNYPSRGPPSLFI